MKIDVTGLSISDAIEYIDDVLLDNIGSEEYPTLMGDDPIIMNKLAMMYYTDYELKK